MKKKSILTWLIIGCILHVSFTNTSRFSILKNLQPLIKKLCTGTYTKAILFSPTFTHTSSLIKAANQGTHIMLVSRDKQIPKELQHPNITYRHAAVHDKLYLTQENAQSPEWSCHFGSANFSHNGLEQNRELIVHIEDPLHISGLAKHAQTILNKSMIPDNLPDPGRSVDSDFSQLASASIDQQLADLEEFNKQHQSPTAFPRIISSFDSDLVEHLSRSIKTDHRTCNYCISTMTLNHPLFIKRILATASLCDSKIKILVDKKWAQKKLQSDNEFTNLVKKAKQSDNKIQIRAASKREVPGYHHAKLLIREPINHNDSRGISLVSTANLTTQAKRDSNCILEIPHTDTEKETTQDLKKNFEEWWKASEGIALS